MASKIIHRQRTYHKTAFNPNWKSWGRTYERQMAEEGWGTKVVMGNNKMTIYCRMSQSLFDCNARLRAQNAIIEAVTAVEAK